MKTLVADIVVKGSMIRGRRAAARTAAENNTGIRGFGRYLPVDRLFTSFFPIFLKVLAVLAGERLCNRQPLTKRG